jgi:hypothetical protein
MQIQKPYFKFQLKTAWSKEINSFFFDEPIKNESDITELFIDLHCLLNSDHVRILSATINWMTYVPQQRVCQHLDEQIPKGCPRKWAPRQEM